VICHENVGNIINHCSLRKNAELKGDILHYWLVITKASTSLHLILLELTESFSTIDYPVLNESL